MGWAETGFRNTSAASPRAGWSGGCSSTPTRCISPWPWPRARARLRALDAPLGLDRRLVGPGAGGTRVLLDARGSGVARSGLRGRAGRRSHPTSAERDRGSPSPSAEGMGSDEPDRGSGTAGPGSRSMPSACCARCSGSAASRRRRPSCTAWARSAASCTSTSARRRWRSGRCRRSGRGTPSSRPTASTATRWPAASRRGRSWRRCSARPTAAAAAAAARCTCSTSRGDSTAATRSWPAGCRSRSAWPWPTSCLGRPSVTACFFGDGAVAEGEFHESLNLAALWKLPVLFLCENNLYAMGTALERHQAQTDISLKAPRLRPAGRGRGRHGRPRRRGGGAPRRGGGPRRGRAVPARGPDLPLPRPLDVRPGALPQQGRGRALEAARPDHASSRRGSARRGSWPTPTSRRWRRRWPPRSTRRSRFAEAGPWEPVEDLTRDVYTPVAPMTTR